MRPAGKPTLGMGNREWVTAPDFMSWVQDAYLLRRQRAWDKIRPLVFINACHPAELDPQALFNYVDAFVVAGNAAGVIGTEVKVHQDLAMQFAQRFFDELLSADGAGAAPLPAGLPGPREPFRPQLHAVLLGRPDREL
jgi:hypothetical protein